MLDLPASHVCPVQGAVLSTGQLGASSQLGMGIKQRCSKPASSNVLTDPWNMPEFRCLLSYKP